MRSGLIVVAFIAGVMLGWLVGTRIVHDTAMAQHRDWVFKEQVERHNCKRKSIWRDGVAVQGAACVLPDGTILMKE